MDFNKEKFEYILTHVYYYIFELIDNVLQDSPDDPQYSAVTTSNIIKCYIEIMQEISPKLPYSNVKEFFLYSGDYSQEDFELFEKSRERESAYYIGKQF